MPFFSPVFCKRPFSLASSGESEGPEADLNLLYLDLVWSLFTGVPSFLFSLLTGCGSFFGFDPMTGPKTPVHTGLCFTQPVCEG